MEQVLKNRKIIKFSTNEQLKTFIEQQKLIFDKVRLVDVTTAKVYYLDEHRQISVEHHACYEFWNRAGKCQNCSSAKAFTTKGQVTKYEFIDDCVYFVISNYVEVNNKTYILEMISQSDDHTLYGAQGKNQIAKILTELNTRAYTDSLTKVFNRAYYDEQIKGIVGQNDGVMMLDVNKFKIINDTYGHVAGDIVLKALAEVMLSMTRQCDAVIRYGGDEFLIVFRNIGEAAFQKRLYQVRDAIRNIRLKEYPDVNLSASIGGIYCQVQPQRSLIGDIDKLLYKAKQEKEDICYEVITEANHEKEN